MKKSFNKPYIHTLFNKVAYSGCMFISNAILTRALGVNLKGDYTWLINYASIISIILGLGIYQSIPYFYRKAHDKREMVKEYFNIFIFQFIIYVLLAIGIILFNHGNITVTLLAILIIVDTLSQQLNMLLLIDDIIMRNKIFIGGAFVNLVLSIVVYVFLRNNLVAATFVTVAVKIFYIFGYSAILKIVPNFSKISFYSIFSKIKFGYLPMLSFLMTTLNYKVDVLMLKSAGNVSAQMLSFYSVGVSLAELAWFLPDVFKEVLFSKTARDNNYEEIASVLRISNFLMMVVVLGIVVCGRILILLFFGKQFLNSYFITIILFLGIPAMSWFKIINTLFNAQGKRKLNFMILTLSAVCNIVVNYISIPYLGIYGAGLASILSYTITGMIFLVLFSRCSGIKFRHLFILKKKDFKVLLK